MHSGQIFVLAMMAIFSLSGVLHMWVKAKHGYPLLHEGRAARRESRLARRHRKMMGRGQEAEQEIQALTNENQRLTNQISRMEERIAVLERIATDPAERVAREIDSLR